MNKMQENPKLAGHRAASCKLCQARLTEPHILPSTGMWFLIEDKYPVTPGHLLIVPCRHVNDITEISMREWASLGDFIYTIVSSDPNITNGCCNIGFNLGRDAGQTIDHLHCHVIPRTAGDVENPIGGIRNIIPGKGTY